MIVFLNKLPIPNLKHYCLFSFGLVAIVLIYTQKLFYEIKNNNYVNDKFNVVESSQLNGLFHTTYKAITYEPWCIWILINFCYCGILLISKVIQGIIFGKLRAVENQHIKDHFWNFIFLKFIFIFGVLNLENVNEVILWCTWFSIIGFLAIHCQICKDRFEYLSFSTTTPLRNHVKVLLLLMFIQILCFCLIVISFMTQKNIGISMGLFMFAEAFGLTLRTLYVITRYAVHLWDIHNLAQWNNKGTIVYYIDFLFETSVVSIDFLHYLHMLVYGNFYLSMASLVICMELKRLFFDLKRRMKRHSNYLKVIEKMEKRFPWASQEELENSDKCAVCWDKLDNARRLPCSHIFHHNCLRSWLEQDTSCPTCRKSLQDEKEAQRSTFASAATNNQNVQQQPTGPETINPNNANDQANIDQQTQQQQQQQQQFVNYQRNLFHFDGSRYISWLPSFSLQVTNGNALLPLLRGNRLEPERLNEMTQQISQMFPHIPLDQIQNDLRQTHSIELTIENILQDRLSLNNPNNSVNSVSNNANRRNNLLHDNEYSDDDDDDEDDDDEEDDDMSSSDDENLLLNNSSNSNNSGASNSNATNNANSNNANSELANSSIRRRNLLFGNLLGGTSSNTGNNANADQTTSNSNSDYQIEGQRSRVDENNAGLLSKYLPSSKLSENANSLIQRKRDLILDSKKRYLEKCQQQQQTQASQSSDNKNLNNEELKT